MEMKKRISEELGGKKPAEVVELLLDSCLSADGELDGLTEDFTQLEVLSLCNVGLKSLSKLPKLPKLRRLELSDNNISLGLDTLAEKCPALTYVNLSGNNIKDMSAVKGLQKLPQLQSVELDEDEEDEEQWRDRVFELLPQISFLNGFDQDHNQAPDEDDDEAGPHDDDEDDDEDDEEDEGSEEDEEVGLSYLMKEGIQDEEDDGDYVEEEEDEEDEEDGEQALMAVGLGPAQIRAALHQLPHAVEGTQLIGRHLLQKQQDEHILLLVKQAEAAHTGNTGSCGGTCALWAGV